MTGFCGSSHDDDESGEPVPSRFTPEQAIDLDHVLRSTGTPWGSSRWAEVARCEVAAAIRYEPGRYKLPVVQSFRGAQAPAVGRGSGEEAEGTSAASSPAGDIGSVDPNPRLTADATPFESSGKTLGKSVGTLCHAVISWQAEHEQRGELDPEAWRMPLQRADELDEWDPAATLEARRLMTAYRDQHGGWSWADAGFRILAVEQPFEQPIGDLPNSGCADLILEDLHDGRVWFADHKTMKARMSSKDNEGAIRREYSVRPQFLALSYHVRSYYNLDYFPGIFANVIVKTKSPAFYRVPVKLLDRTVQLWHDAQVSYAARRARGDQPVPNLHECIGRYGPCWAYGICHGEENLYLNDGSGGEEA